MREELAPEQKRSYENGIRIFARWIARAYVKDLSGVSGQEKVRLRIKNENADEVLCRTPADCLVCPEEVKKARAKSVNAGAKA